MLPLMRRHCSRCSTKLIHFCKKLQLALDCRQSKYSFQIYNIFFSILGVVFGVPLLCYFQKLQFLAVKKFWNKFCNILQLFVWAQKVACLIFLKAYFKLNRLIFLSFLVSFLVNILNWKAPFLTKKTSTVNSETPFSREAKEN